MAHLHMAHSDSDGQRALLPRGRHAGKTLEDVVQRGDWAYVRFLSQWDPLVRNRGFRRCPADKAWPKALPAHCVPDHSLRAAARRALDGRCLLCLRPRPATDAQSRHWCDLCFWTNKW